MEKVVLGFSGGLDTTFCVKYLTEDKGLEVHSVIVNTGGFTDEELKKVEAHAYALGVKTHTTVNAVKGYYDSIIKYLVYGNVLKNNTYPLSVSAERLSQALHIAEHVKKVGAKLVAHGSTGAGNDQVRFDMIFQIMIPGIEILMSKDRKNCMCTAMLFDPNEILDKAQSDAKQASQKKGFNILNWFSKK